MKDIERAKIKLAEGYSLVLYKGDTEYVSRERGVKALLRFLDEKTELTGFAAADNVVGKGAAFLYVLLGVKTVYAKILSDSARETLAAFGIEAEWETLVPRIVNRDKTGYCPIEEATLGISDPTEALAAIRKRLKELKTN